MYRLHPLNLIKQYWIALSIATALLITILSLWPLPHLPSVPGSDKTHHFIAYATLAFPAAFVRPKYWLFIMLFFVSYGGLIELIQPYVNRYGEWLDMLANTGGVLCGILFATILRMIKPL